MNIIHNQKGFAMPLVLMVMLVISLLGTALWQYSMVETKHVDLNQKQLQAYYLAKAGAEATIAAWLKEPIGQKPAQGTVKKIYYTKDREFVLTDPGPDKVGEVDISIDIDEHDLTTITATAAVDGVTEQVAATTYPYVDGSEVDPALYNKETGKFEPGPTNVPATVNSKNVTVKTHPLVDGAVKFNAAGSRPLYLASNTSVGLQATVLDFQSTLNVRQNHNMDTGALSLAAQYIVFESDLYTDGFYYRSWLTGDTLSYYGTVILRVPDGMGMELPGKSGTYGKVFFKNAYITENWLLGIPTTNSMSMANKAYYFKKRPDGIDLIKWHRGQYTKGVDYIEITGEDAASIPQGSDLFFWHLPESE